MSTRFLRLLTNEGHLCAIDAHHCRFGDSHRPVCLEDGCRYVGPFVNEERAHAIAEEHRQKTAGTWRPAR